MRSLKRSELKDFMCGCMLGDGCLTFRGRNAKYAEHHAIKQKPYLDWKEKVFNKNLNVKTRRYTRDQRPKRNSITSILETNISKFFTKIYFKFYKDGKKIVPYEYLEKYFDTFGLAVWFCDDGNSSFYKNGTPKTVVIATNSFSDNSVQFLIDLLSVKFGLRGKLVKYKGMPLIKLYGKDNINKLYELIKPHIIPNMEYKISYESVQHLDK